MCYYGNIGQLEDKIKNLWILQVFSLVKTSVFGKAFFPKSSMLSYIIVLISSSIWTDIVR